MDAAKKSGQRGLLVYSQEIDRAARALDGRIRELRRAIAEQQLRVVYQPMYDLATGRLAGAEALVRWSHPERGPVPADEFIALAEDADLIVDIDTFVVERVSADSRRWHDAGLPQVRLSANVSAHTLESGRLAPLVRSVLDVARPPRLELEITESVAFRDFAFARDTIAELRSMGLGIAIDDFGTGYSMLARLRRLTFDALKIDREFVQDPSAGSLVASMISMGHALGARIQAEGVETREQLEFLRSHGCDEGQGFLLGRPMEARAFAGVLRGAGAAVAPETDAA
jgi:EAL domain-containing protein (putative c-di-GMP-specific phosphodiesterase class I)